MEVALYRKYRPSKFKEVWGQDHIVKVLEGSIEAGKISHAYLFAGSRGTGKTSIARIFAKEIGCSPNDLYEIDAASNRGIDDVREIRDGVGVLPFESKYKVYIVDEVHMLTKEAFNALLKTLEEPPSHAIFILATTEIEKLPDTVISRCQTFEFRKPNRAMLKDVVLDISKKEGFKIEPSSADLVALMGDGSFRDTLGILQKVLSSSSDEKISVEEVEMVTGAPKTSLVNNFVEALAMKEGEKGFKAISEASKKNIDMKVFLKLVLQKLRFALLLRFGAGMEEEIHGEISDEDFDFLKKLSTDKSAKLNSQTLLELLNAYDNVGRAHIPELPLELALAKIVREDL